MRHNPSFVDRILFAIWGALLGAFGALGACWWLDQLLPWKFIGIVAGASALLSFALGRELVDWLKDLVRYVWS